MAVRSPAIRIAWILVLGLACSACAVVRTPEIRRIALFAPFEGRYREIGYNALYAARLALSEAQSVRGGFELLAVDSGGTEAENRARALAQDPLVMVVVALGYDATTPEVLRAFGDVPVLIVGEWGAQPISDNIFIFSNPEISEQISAPPNISVTDAAELPAPVVGSDVFALEGFAKLRGALDGVTVLSSGELPDADLTARYRGSDSFAPEPGLLAILTARATTTAIFFASGSESRTQVQRNLAPDFSNGYWNEAEINRYVYMNGTLTESVEP